MKTSIAVFSGFAAILGLFGFVLALVTASAIVVDKVKALAKPSSSILDGVWTYQHNGQSQTVTFANGVAMFNNTRILLMPVGTNTWTFPNEDGLQTTAMYSPSNNTITMNGGGVDNVVLTRSN